MHMKRSCFLGLLIAMSQLVFSFSSFAMGRSIHDAAKAGNTVKVLRLIDENPTNRDVANKYGNTPLYFATSYGHTETALALIARGANVHGVSSSDGLTLLHRASSKGNIEIVQALVSAGADVDALDDFANTPLQCANYTCSTAVVQILIAAGANINSVNRFASTPLHQAALQGCTAIVQILVAAGANVEARDQYGTTPLELAKSYRRTATVAALQPEAIAQIHTTEALRQTQLGNYDFAATSHSRAAEAHTAAGNHDAARLSQNSALLSKTLYEVSLAAARTHEEAEAVLEVAKTVSAAVSERIRAIKVALYESDAVKADAKIERAQRILQARTELAEEATAVGDGPLASRLLKSKIRYSVIEKAQMIRAVEKIPSNIAAAEANHVEHLGRLDIFQVRR